MASNSQAAASRKKLVHHLDTPFSTVSWPEISPEDQDAILELLCTFLSPIGQHRRLCPEKSKRRKNARRDKTDISQRDPSAEASSQPKPPQPEIANRVDVGFNSITRRLSTKPPQSLKSDDAEVSNEARQYSMVFVARGDQSSAFNCHFPQMVGAASAALPPHVEKTRLVGFSKPCSEKLSRCLGVARVSSLAIERNVPEAAALWYFVSKHVEAVDASWLDSGANGRYHPSSIVSSETTVGTKRVKTTLS